MRNHVQSYLKLKLSASFENTDDYWNLTEVNTKKVNLIFMKRGSISFETTFQVGKYCLLMLFHTNGNVQFFLNLYSIYSDIYFHENNFAEYLKFEEIVQKKGFNTKIRSFLTPFLIQYLHLDEVKSKHKRLKSWFIKNLDNIFENNGTHNQLLQITNKLQRFIESKFLRLDGFVEDNRRLHSKLTKGLPSSVHLVAICNQNNGKIVAFPQKRYPKSDTDSSPFTPIIIRLLADGKTGHVLGSSKSFAENCTIEVFCKINPFNFSKHMHAHTMPRLKQDIQANSSQDDHPCSTCASQSCSHNLSTSQSTTHEISSPRKHSESKFRPKTVNSTWTWRPDSNFVVKNSTYSHKILDSGTNNANLKEPECHTEELKPIIRDVVNFIESHYIMSIL